MLHTLNKAWITILANQINKGMIESALFVTSGNEEYMFTENLLTELCGMKNCWVFDKGDVEFGVSVLLGDQCFDDVLVSHEATGSMLHNFLAKHCNRVMHNRGC